MTVSLTCSQIVYLADALAPRSQRVLQTAQLASTSRTMVHAKHALTALTAAAVERMTVFVTTSSVKHVQLYTPRVTSQVAVSASHLGMAVNVCVMRTTPSRLVSTNALR